MNVRDTFMIKISFHKFSDLFRRSQFLFLNLWRYTQLHLWAKSYGPALRNAASKQKEKYLKHPTFLEEKLLFTVHCGCMH